MAPTLLAAPLSENTACNELPPRGPYFPWGGPAENCLSPELFARQCSDATKQALQAQPLLRPETTAVVTVLLDLIAHASGVVALLEVDGAEQHVPPGQQHAKIVPTQCLAACRLVPDAYAVVQPVKARADPEPLANLPKPQPHIGVLKACAELGEGHDGDELAGGHAYELRHQHDDAVHQDVVEQVVAVVAPHGHLPLRMVQRMQPPPPRQLVLAAVRPVGDKVKRHQVDQQADQRVVTHAGPELVEVKSAVAGGAQRAKGLVKPRVQREKQRNAEQAQPVNQRVQNVGANGGAVSHRLHRAPALQRPYQRQQNEDLDQPHHEPGRGLVAVFEQIAQAQRKHGGLHGGLKQPLLQLRENIGEPVHIAYFAGLAGARLACPSIQVLY